MKKKTYLSLLFAMVMMVLFGCKQATSQSPAKSAGSATSQSAVSSETKDYSKLSFDELVKEAEGTTVNFYGWGGDENLNNWLDTFYANYMKEHYNITINRVPMDIDQINVQLANEKQLGEDNGEIDMIWINGENFKSDKENGLLYGPFVDALPNYKAYVDMDDPENTYDFGYPIEGYEAPYGKAQLVMIKDEAKAPETIKNAADFKKFVEAHPGQVTYPALPDFTGSAFVRNIIYEFVDPSEFKDMPEDKAIIKKKIQPALDYLKSLNPYLWHEGKSFPSSSMEQENMYADGELLFHVTYGSFDNAINIEKGKFPDSSQTFQFDKGTIGNTNYLAIGASSKHKAGAMVAINAMLDPKVQLSKVQTLKVLPAVAATKMTGESKEKFQKADMGKNIIPVDELLSKRLPEMPAGLVPIIEEIWLEEVVGK